MVDLSFGLFVCFTLFDISCFVVLIGVCAESSFRLSLLEWNPLFNRLNIDVTGALFANFFNVEPTDKG